MINSHLFCVVMAGGLGTRFWPESTRKRPKQYLSLFGNQSLAYQTLERFQGLVPKGKRYVITTRDQEPLARESSGDLLDEENILLEPAGRNTAPCILLALAHLVEKGARDEDVVIISPADHAIVDKAGFQDTVKEAFELAVSQEKIITIGIPPHCPHTGYGYIQRGESLRGQSYLVQSFREKPDVATAKEYHESGEYYWNAGMFVARVDVFLEQFKEHALGLFSSFRELREKIQDAHSLGVIYQELEKISIDYAIMEKSKKIVVTPARFDWSDLGSWDALYELYQEIEGDHWSGDNLVLNGLGGYCEDSKNNLVWAPDKVVALVGVEDLVVVSTEKQLLIIKKSQAQKVKNAVDFFSTHPIFKDFV